MEVRTGYSADTCRTLCNRKDCKFHRPLLHGYEYEHATSPTTSSGQVANTEGDVLHTDSTVNSPRSGQPPADSGRGGGRGGGLGGVLGGGRDLRLGFGLGGARAQAGNHAGITNYSAEEISALLDLVSEHEPHVSHDYVLVESDFGKWASANGAVLRDTDSLRKKFDKLAHTNKKTGNPTCPLTFGALNTSPKEYCLGRRPQLSDEDGDKSQVKILALGTGVYGWKDNGTATGSNRAAIQHRTAGGVRVNKRRAGATEVQKVVSKRALMHASYPVWRRCPTYQMPPLLMERR